MKEQQSAGPVGSLRSYGGPTTTPARLLSEFKPETQEWIRKCLAPGRPMALPSDCLVPYDPGGDREVGGCVSTDGILRRKGYEDHVGDWMWFMHLAELCFMYDSVKPEAYAHG